MPGIPGFTATPRREETVSAFLTDTVSVAAYRHARGAPRFSTEARFPLMTSFIRLFVDRISFRCLVVKVLPVEQVFIGERRPRRLSTNSKISTTLWWRTFRRRCTILPDCWEEFVFFYHHLYSCFRLLGRGGSFTIAASVGQAAAGTAFGLMSIIMSDLIGQRLEADERYIGEGFVGWSRAQRLRSG